MQSQLLRNLACVGGVTGMTLTFMHPVMWLPVAASVGLAVLIAIATTLTARAPEPPAFHVAVAWLLATLALAVANGFAEGFYNSAHVVFVLFGLLLGYLISITRTPGWAAWLPFALFAAYFLGTVAIGRDPGEALTRNSRNFISVIMLALYASAIVLSKPTRVGTLHVVAAVVTVVLAVAATGRGGIIASLALLTGLSLNIALRGRMSFLRVIGTTVALLVAAVVAYFGIVALLDLGQFGRLAQRGLQDASRIAMILAYFNGIEPMELFLGRNYYDDPFLARWDFNLHNSYLAAWAHVGLFYLLFILATLALVAKRLRVRPVFAFAIGALALRALTDTQVFAAKYDYIVFAALFILLREPSPSAAHRTSPRPLPTTASGAPGT